FPLGTLLLHQSLSVMAPCYLSLLLAPQLFILPCILIMFWFLHNLLRILSLFASSLPIIIAVEFDPSGCSVKDLQSRNVIVRCNSSGPLYPLRLPAARSLVATSGSSLWHRRLGHPGHEAFSKLASSSGLPTCSHDSSSSLCHACQLGH